MFVLLFVLPFLGSVHPEDEVAKTITIDLHKQPIVSSASSPSNISIPEIFEQNIKLPLNQLVNKTIPDVLAHFSPVKLIKPISDKIGEFIAISKHPNYGGLQFFSPQHLWEKLHEKGHNFLNGPTGAIFGLANHRHHDYPFAYRNLDTKSKLETNKFKH